MGYSFSLHIAKRAILTVAAVSFVMSSEPSNAQGLSWIFPAKKAKTTSHKSQVAKKSTVRKRTVRKKKRGSRLTLNSSTGHKSLSKRVNGGRVGIISGGIGGTYIRIATDLASVLNDGDKLRILPIVGQGSVQNITDILYLKGIDVGIVQSDVLSFIKSRGLHSNIEQRIHYITKLYNEEFHLVGGREIEDIRDLEGKAVNFGVSGSGTYMTATTVFQKLGIKVKPVSFDQALAIEKIRSGEIAATVFVAGKPARAVADLKGTYGLQLIPVKYDRPLQNAYLPARFSSEDYPELVPSGQTVDSIAVGAVMAVYNWPNDNPRRQRVERFVDAFFSRLEDFQTEPRHKKWREVNLSAKVPGWKRFRSARRWLAANSKADKSKLKTAFNAFLNENADTQDANPTGAERENLFQQFLQWQKQRN
ncbi:MAG: TAXI family TRAP transporter solute-binding subunit [Hyphomicrobiaceae bacterium]